MSRTRRQLLICIAALVFTLSGCFKSTQIPPASKSSPEQSQIYIEWLEKQSMLYNAGILSQSISGQGVQWRHPYARPQTEEIVTRASVWVLGYPGSMITRPHESVLQYSKPETWFFQLSQPMMRASMAG